MTRQLAMRFCQLAREAGYHPFMGTQGARDNFTVIITKDGKDITLNNETTLPELDWLITTGDSK